jgi:hypothetical protein
VGLARLWWEAVTGPWLRGSIALVCGIAAACDPISTLRGVVRTPVDGCPARTDQAVVDAEVRLLCKNLDERAAEPNPSQSDGQGEFVFHTASFDTFSETCRVRVTKLGYEPIEAALSELHYRASPAEREVRIEVPLRRVSSP